MRYREDSLFLYSYKSCNIMRNLIKLSIKAKSLKKWNRTQDQKHMS
jgi:hypothetical protein